MLDHSPPATRPTSSGYGSSSSRISGCATVSIHRRLVGLQRRVHAHVAVDRRAALEPLRGVRRAPAHDAAERQRAGLGADDSEARRLREQRGVERRVALERRERAEPAVLLRGRPPATRPRACPRPPREATPKRAARPRPRPSCPARLGRAGARPPRRPTTGRGARPRCRDRRRPHGRSGTGARPPRRVASLSAPTARRAAPPHPDGQDWRAARRGRADAGQRRARRSSRARPGARAPHARRR